MYVSESLIQQFLKTIYLMYSLWIHYIWFLWNNYFITSGRFSASWKIAPDKELGNRRRKHHRGHAIAIVNAYLLHSHDCKTIGLTPLSFHNFKLKLIAELVGPKLRSQLPAAAPQMEPVTAKAKLNPIQGHKNIVQLWSTCSEPQCHRRHRSLYMKCYEVEGQVRTLCTVKSEKSDGRCWSKHLPIFQNLNKTGQPLPILIIIIQ